MRPLRALAATGVALAVLAGCGGQLSDEEILQANGVTPNTAQAPAAVPAPGAVEPGTVPSANAPATAPSVAPGTAPGTTGAPAPTAPAAGKDSGKSAAKPGAGTQPAKTAAVGTPGQTGPIVVGSVGDYSGPAGAAQAGIPRGVQVWAAAVNSQGGLFGRQVQVIVVDDGGDPARYASAVRDLVENRGAVAFVGNGASLAMKGGTSYLESKKVPVFGSDCSVPEWFQGAVYFPQCASFTSQVTNVMAAGRRISGKTKFGFLVCSEANACTSQKPILLNNAKTAGVDLVYSADVSLTQVDFTAECRNAQRAGVELFYIAADPNTLSRVARSCSRQGFNPQYTQASVSVGANTKDLDGVGDLIVEMPVFPFAGGKGGVIDEYTKAFAQFSGSALGPADAYGWAAGKLFEKVATDTARAEQKLTSQGLITAAGKVKNETLGGLVPPLTFTSGKATPADCYFAVQARNGQWTTPLGNIAQCTGGRT
jgi:branched-chain amino acid transport system substrate-binding protein